MQLLIMLLPLSGAASTPPKPSEESPKQLVEAFCNSNLRDRQRLKEDLLQMGLPAARELIGMLRSDNGVCWERTSDVLAAMGPAAKDVLPELLELLRSSRSANPPGSAAQYRMAYVAVAASGVGKGDARVEDTLVDMLNDPPFSRGLAAKLLGDLKAKRATPALAAALNDNSAMVAESAAAALLQMGHAAEAAVPALAAVAAKDPTSYLAKLCVKALRAIGTPAATAALGRLDAKRPSK